MIRGQARSLQEAVAFFTLDEAQPELAAAQPRLLSSAGR